MNSMNKKSRINVWVNEISMNEKSIGMYIHDPNPILNGDVLMFLFTAPLPPPPPNSVPTKGN